MGTVTVSTQYQVVIPRRVRQSLYTQPGQGMQVIEYGNPIVMVPICLIQEARGALKALITTHNVKRKTGTYEHRRLTGLTGVLRRW